MALKDALKVMYCIVEQISHLKLSEDHWELVATIYRYLRPFKQCSPALCGERYVNISFVVLAFNMLLDRIDSIIQELLQKQRNTV